MTEQERVLVILADFLEEQPTRAPANLMADVLKGLDASPQRGRWPQLGAGWPETSRAAFRLAAAVAAIAAVVVVAWWAAHVPSVGPIVSSSPVATPSAATAPPSEIPTATPTPIHGTATPGPSVPGLGWTPEALMQDWPGPIRVEAGAQVYRYPEGVWQRADTVGELGPEAPDWIDIRNLTINTGEGASGGRSNGIGLQMAGPLASLPPSSDAWIAYGVVLDVDGDGEADQRIGMDNGPGSHREWVTDLATGETSVNAGSPYGHGAFDTLIDTYYIGEGGFDPADTSVTLRISRAERGLRFYTWSSLIQDGRIVATDFAPDAGWVDTYQGPTGDPPPTPTSLGWTSQSAQFDWPGDLRLEQLSASLNGAFQAGDGTARFVDGWGDRVGWDGLLDDGQVPEFIDIREIAILTGSAADESRSNVIELKLAGAPAGLPPPAEQWIAYGLVLDVDGDGWYDQRIGVDNAPDGGRRVWIHDFRSGLTTVNSAPPWGLVAEGTSIETRYVGEGDATDPGSPPSVTLTVRRDSPALRFYAWASLIQDGRIAATDYVPGMMWIETYGGPR